MSDRAYYCLLEPGKRELSRVKLVGDGHDGLHVEDLRQAELEAMAQVRAWNKILVGPDAEATFHASWIAEASAYPTAVPPIRVQRVARLLGSSLIWEQYELFHGVAAREEMRGSASRGAVKLTAAKRLLASAVDVWAAIVSDKTFIMPDGSTVDLATYTETGGIGISAPIATFFPDESDVLSYGYRAIYTLEDAFRGLR